MGNMESMGRDARVHNSRKWKKYGDDYEISYDITVVYYLDGEDHKPSEQEPEEQEQPEEPSEQEPEPSPSEEPEEQEPTPSFWQRIWMAILNFLNMFKIRW